MRRTLFTTVTDEDHGENTFQVEGIDSDIQTAPKQPVTRAAMAEGKKLNRPVYLVGFMVPNRDAKNQNFTGGDRYIPVTFRTRNYWHKQKK